MNKIAYIELDTHTEIAGNFMELMENSDQFELDYFFSKKVFQQIGKHQSNVFLTESSEIINQLSKKNYDLVIIGTVHRYFNIFNAITAKFNTAVIVHNRNFTKISKFQLLLNIFKKDGAYRIKLGLKEDLFSAPEVFKNAKHLLVLDENLGHNNLKFLPVFFNKFNKKVPSEKITIVIPGSVSQSRRDYENVFSTISAFEIEIKNGFHLSKENIEFVFLGKAQGSQLKQLVALEQSLEKISIHYFTEKVPVIIFDEWMNKADFLWCPIQSETEFFSHKEIYGKTKMSGNIGDAIKYGKTAFFPADYQSDLPFIVNIKENPITEILRFNSEHPYQFQTEFNQNKIALKLEETLKTLL